MSSKTQIVRGHTNHKKDFEQLAADARKKRQEACVKEYNSMLAELLKRHNCRGVFVVLMNGQAIPSEQILNVPVGFVITANIEGNT